MRAGTAAFHSPLSKCCACSFCLAADTGGPEPRRQPTQADGGGGAAAAASGPAASVGERDVPPPSGRAAAMARSAAGPPTSDADGHRHSVALGVLTESRESARFKAMESTWLTQFDSVMVFESHTESVSRV